MVRALGMAAVSLAAILCTAEVSAGTDKLSAVEFSVWSNLPAEVANEKALAEPYLLKRESVDSVNGFNPFTCDACNVTSPEQLADGRFTDEEAWKWFRYRRAEIGSCFEDEDFNPKTKLCEVIE